MEFDPDELEQERFPSRPSGRGRKCRCGHFYKCISTDATEGLKATAADMGHGLNNIWNSYGEEGRNNTTVHSMKC
jgi:hypothetical protein